MAPLGPRGIQFKLLLPLTLPSKPPPDLEKFEVQGTELLNSQVDPPRKIISNWNFVHSNIVILSSYLHIN